MVTGVSKDRRPSIFRVKYILLYPEHKGIITFGNVAVYQYTQRNVPEDLNI
jgi:hypothetical protein